VHTTRRTILGLGLGGLAGTLLPASAEAGPFDLTNWSTNWVLHKDPKLGASLTPIANGIILKAAPISTDSSVYQRSSIAIWNKNLWTGDFRVEFDFTRLDNTTKTTGNGIGAMLYWHVVGKGDAAHPASIAQWPSKAANEKTYIRYSRGYRVTWSNFNTQSPQNSHEIRLRRFAFTTNYPVQIGGDSPAKFFFEKDKKYHMILERSGSTFKVIVGTESHTWNESVITLYNDGYFGIRHQPGRWGRYENFSITVP
jgi:hypothetical protein